MKGMLHLLLSMVNQGLKSVEEQQQTPQTMQGGHNNHHNPSLHVIKTIQITLFQNSFSDPVQLVCGVVSQIQ